MQAFGWQAHCLDSRGRFSYEFQARAGMAELVDAVDSKSTGGNALGVRFPLPVPTKNSIRSKTVQEAQSFNDKPRM